MTVLLRNGSLIDGTGAIHEGSSVLFDSRIRAISAAGNEPTLDSDVEVIDLEGATILPGFINLHIHAQRRHFHRQSIDERFREGATAFEAQDEEVRFAWAVKNCWQELMEGSTTFRDCGSGAGLSNRVRWAFASGVLNGPRLVTSGEAIAITGGHGTHYKNLGARPADGPEGVRRAVREELAMGADWIKLMASSGLAGMPVEDPRWPEFTVDELAAGVEAAHARSARVCAHAFFPAAIKNAVEAGVDCIEHGQIIDEETAATMAKAGTFYVPTTSGQTEYGRRETHTGNPEVADILAHSVVGPHSESIATAFAAGVKIGAGTDTLGQMVKELELFHAAGIPEMDCLQAATSTAADILGLTDDIGSIEPGKFADVLVVRGNPLDDLGALRNVEYVFKAGHLVTPEWLVGSVEEAMARPTLDPARPLHRRARSEWTQPSR